MHLSEVKMEQFDIYDYTRLPTGRSSENPSTLKCGQYRLVIHICIFNSHGEMLIQRRQSTTGKWPGLWDLSVSGCVQAGESAAEAAMREAHEELGLSLDLSVSPVSLSITFNRGYDDIFILQSDVDISSLLLQEDEVADVKWAKKEEILNLLAEKKFVPFFPAFIETLFAYKDYGDIHS
jgi:isopentenyldiphosphate isomerase